MSDEKLEDSPIVIDGRQVRLLAEMTLPQRIRIATLVMTKQEMMAAFPAEDLKDAAKLMTGVRPPTERDAVNRIRTMQDAELAGKA